MCKLSRKGTKIKVLQVFGVSVFLKTDVSAGALLQCNRQLFARVTLIASAGDKTEHE